MPLNPLLIDALYMVIYTNIIFLAILFLLIFKERKNEIHKDPPQKSFPSVSILIPAFNEENSIAQTIDAVRAMDYPKNKLEVIVIDDFSKDKTSEIARAKGVKVFRNETNKGKAYSVNRGLVNAKGEFIATVDADSFPRKTALSRAMRYFTSEKVAAVTTSIFVKYDSGSFLARMQRIEYILILATRKLLQYINAIYALPGPLTIYRKDVMLKLGGFDEKNMTEDIEAAFRLLSNGYEIKMSFDSHVYTKVPKTFKSWWKQRVRWGIGGMQTFRKYKWALFDPRLSTFGLFVVPMFGVSYIFTFTGLFLTARWIGDFLNTNILFTYGSIKAGLSLTDVFRTAELIFNPTALTIMLGLIFAAGLTLFGISFRESGSKMTKGKWYFDVPIYLLFFSIIFPYTLVHSAYRLWRGKFQW
jgi:cellulose synthase/poly-beta-1,6-N-acetylglucosamine synthase-like glycosyltransferase